MRTLCLAMAKPKGKKSAFRKVYSSCTPRPQRCCLL
uniref:Uncharacterized protein n=1 Tax=Anguilla anguilla TaxID=7936 RepID=A0A0E9SAE1_ANGAN